MFFTSRKNSFLKFQLCAEEELSASNLLIVSLCFSKKRTKAIAGKPSNPAYKKNMGIAESFHEDCRLVDARGVEEVTAGRYVPVRALHRVVATGHARRVKLGENDADARHFVGPARGHLAVFRGA